MSSISSNRIQSLDILKGLVIVLMALDHVRDYFHFSANYFDPADPILSTLPIFFTRWVTHFCAPIFSFLAGISAFLVGIRKTKPDLSLFLFKRGLWLVLIEVTVVNFAWYFDLHFQTVNLLVIWSLGISMLFLSILIYLPRNLLLVLCLILIFGHNLLDEISLNGILFWDLLHYQNFHTIIGNRNLLVGYPLIPWIAVMALGYYSGILFRSSFPAEKRRQLLFSFGTASIILFLILRFTNFYGDPVDFISFEGLQAGIISFLNPSKYPPSLLYLAMTLGGAFLLLAAAEKWKGKLVEFLAVFGRVPFFFYIIHLYLIHLLAMLMAQLTGFGWRLFILPNWIGFVPEMKGYGFSLGVVYLVWGIIVLSLYPICLKFGRYKLSHKQHWWLSYL
jgi:uncharacterized membrane protein